MFHWLQFWLQMSEQPGIMVLEALQVILTIWMLVDAYHRGVEQWWLWVIFFFQPLGPWVYFFAVKVRDFRTPRLGMPMSSGRRRLSLAQLRYHAERSPTQVNRLALAERLMEKGDHREAIPLLEAILKTEQAYCPALHALALCHLACNEPAQAVPALRRIIEHDRRWSDYRAWRTLIDAYDALDQAEQALQTTRELAKMVPTLESTCLLARRLLDLYYKNEAAEVLDQALTDYEYSPLKARFRNWRWARQARLLLKEAEAEAPVGPK
jgi:hypothetical protein